MSQVGRVRENVCVLILLQLDGFHSAYIKERGVHKPIYDCCFLSENNNNNNNNNYYYY